MEFHSKWNVTQNMQRRLEAIPVPACLNCSDAKCQSMSHTSERDDFVLDNLNAVIEASHATIPMTGGRPASVRPDSGTRPGWREEVAPVQKDAAFWHAVWLSAIHQTSPIPKEWAHKQRQSAL